MKQEYPEFSETMAMGHLQARSYHVRRERLTKAVHVTDPINTALRWRGRQTNSRPYVVSGPNYLWHIGFYSTITKLLLVFL